MGLSEKIGKLERASGERGWCVHGGLDIRDEAGNESEPDYSPPRICDRCGRPRRILRIVDVDMGSVENQRERERLDEL